MNWETLGSIGDFASGMAVVFSLIYVGYELRTNTRVVRASSAALSQDALTTINDLLAANPELSRIFQAVVRRGGVEGLDAADVFRFNLVCRSNLQRFESMYFRYEAGLLEERVWRVRRYWLAGFLATPGVATWWSSERDSSIFTPEFVAEVEKGDSLPLDWKGQRAV